VATEGKLDSTGEGAIVATTSESLSNFLSNPRILSGVWPSLRALAGRLRATCSTHSTLAFWHLGTCHPMWSYKTMKQTYLWQMPAVSDGTHRTLCLRHLSQAKEFPILPSLSMVGTTELAVLGERDPSLSGGALMCGEVRYAKPGVRLSGVNCSPQTRVLCAPEVDAALTGRLTTPETIASEQVSFQVHSTEGYSHVAVPYERNLPRMYFRDINGPQDRCLSGS
jgi:hypothetical protein